MGWNESDHPRDADGRFSDGDDAPSWAEQMSARIGEDSPVARKAWPSNFATALKAQHPGLKLNIHRDSVGTVVLASIVVPERSKGLGTKIMNALTELADRNGDTIALTPSADFGGSKPRLERFYKRFGFIPNKGRNKDYEISETMYRAPS